jgi:acyl transferase domain-containing protein
MKPNIGHPLCAEGIAGFIKSVLMLHKRAIVPFLSAEQPTPYYDFAASPLRFTRALRSWDAPNPAMAINCFADGGTNVHVILEAAPADVAVAVRRAPVAPPPLTRVDVARHGRKQQREHETLVSGSAVNGSTVNGSTVNGSNAESAPQRDVPERFGFWKRGRVDTPRIGQPA